MKAYLEWQRANQQAAKAARERNRQAHFDHEYPKGKSRKGGSQGRGQGRSGSPKGKGTPKGKDKDAGKGYTIFIQLRAGVWQPYRKRANLSQHQHWKKSDSECNGHEWRKCHIIACMRPLRHLALYLT